MIKHCRSLVLLTALMLSPLVHSDDEVSAGCADALSTLRASRFAVLCVTARARVIQSKFNAELADIIREHKFAKVTSVTITPLTGDPDVLMCGVIEKP